MDLNISKIKSIFFIGIGGIGISALTKMALSKDIEVSGVDDNEDSKTISSLKDLNVKIFIKKKFEEFLETEPSKTRGQGNHTFLKIPHEFTLDQLPVSDMYVYSDAWIFRGPEIIEEARKTDKPVLSYAEALGIFAKDYKVIAIAGTHGKTTTTAMIAGIMIDAGFDPTVVVGSFVPTFGPDKIGSNFREGKSEYLLVEADEYNRHFLQFHPYIGVVTNIEADHLDCYKDLADIQEAFNLFLSQSENKITDYQKYVEKVPQLSVPGLHNRMDAATAIAVSDFLNIKEEVAQKSLNAFSGTWRRLEKLGMTKEGTIVYDDYAHHPTEIKASLQALREIYPREPQLDNKKRKIITVLFQPHLFSRTKAFFKEFSEAFDEADNVFILPIYFARESNDESISSQKLSEAIRLHRGESIAFLDFEEAENWLRKMVFGPNDVFVTMGAGEANKIIGKVFQII